jgi:cell division ATPase FtsA
VVDQNINPVMVLDMGAGSTKIYIVERGLIRNTHTINRGSQDITLAISKALGVSVEKAEMMKRDMISGNLTDKTVSDIMTLVLGDIFSEANQVLLNYQKMFNKSISKVILSGGGIEAGKFTESAKANFQTEVEIANPFGKVEAPAFLEGVLKEVGPEFSVTVGVALRTLQEMG